MISLFILSFFSLIPCLSLLILGSLFKVNLIIGSKMAFFSAINITGPLTGLYGSLSFNALIFIILSLCKGLWYGNISLLSTLLPYHIPTFCASAYWRSSSYFIRCGIPLVCMALFVMHPVGGQAAFYAGFWLIPLIIYCIPAPTIFLTALGSTFVAHAVGSVIWLYTLDMQPAYFVALVPIVFIERLLYATGMTLVYYVLASCGTIIKMNYLNILAMTPFRYIK